MSRKGKSTDLVDDDREEDVSSPRAVVRTFLISDIRGYSTFTRERGDEAAARLAMRFAGLAQDAVEARGGTVIQLRGDEALAVFVSTPQAVLAGLELQEACGEATEEDPGPPIPIGIGIDCGEAIPVDDGYRGGAINLAARLCSKATAGQVLVTTGVASVSGGLDDVAFESRGFAELKGFDKPVELLEAVSTSTTVPGRGIASESELPPPFDEPTPLVGRDRELRWLRGTWRQARRGHGRVVFISGPPGIGKTRLAAELASFVQTSGGAVRIAGSGGAGGGETLATIELARSATAPLLCVLEGPHLHDASVSALGASLEAIEDRPALVLGLVPDTQGHPALAELVDRLDVRGDGHRRLGPLGLDEVRDIARSYVGDVPELPAESMLRASGGVPARVHEVVGDWARDEAKRRLATAAEWLAEGRSNQTAGIEFANNVIALKLGRIYGEQRPGKRSDECPYKGLAAFGVSDAAYFYGRERLVGELAARTVGVGLLGVAGPSGSGKSSVVMAGLLPSLAAGLLPGSERWGQAIIRPGEHPVDALERALASRDPGTRLVLVVDQFEEVFTTTTAESERTAFVDRLVELAHDPDGTVVVVTIRADYTGHVAQHRRLADMFESNLVLVGPMTPDDLRRAIEMPARRAGLRVESALADALVEEVGDEPGGLPLLSTALVELWQRRDGAWLRLEARERTGGIRGAVARLAEASHQRLSEPEREAAKSVLLRLVGDGEGASAVRRRVSDTEFDIDRDPHIATVLTRLTDDRLLTRDGGMIEIAHEALIREWPRLRGWLDEDATGRQLRSHLTQSARQWAERDRDPGELYRGARLSATLDWAQEHDRELNALEWEFLEQSRLAGEREAGRQQRQNRRLRGLLVGTALLLAISLVAGSLALVQRSRARRSQAAAETEALRSDAERIGTLAQTEPNLDRSLLLAVAGVELQDRADTRGNLLGALQKAPAAIQVIRPSQSEVSALAVSPDGRLLASGDSAGAVSFTDLESWSPDGAPVRLDGAVSGRAIRFSPDGRALAVATMTANDRSNVYVIDMASRTARMIGSWPSIVSAGPLRFTSVAFSPDGDRIAIAVATATPEIPIPVGERLLLLDPAAGRVVWQRNYPLLPFEQEAAVAFTQSGTLVTSAAQGDTKFWNPKTGQIVRRFAIGGPFGLSPDGRFAAVAQNSPDPSDPSSSLEILDLVNGRHRELADALPVSAWIQSIAMTPDGARIVAGSFEGGVRVWDLASGSIVETFTGQPGARADVALSPSGRTVMSGAEDGSVIAWDLSGVQRLGRTFRWNTPDLTCTAAPCFAIDPQGTIMAADQADGTVALIDLRSLRLIDTLPARNGPVANALAFFPDGRMLATGGINGTVTLWNMTTHSIARTIDGLDPVAWLAVSPGGRLLAVQTQADGSSDSTVDVRDSSTGVLLYSHPVPNGTGGLFFSPDGKQLAALGCCQPDSAIQVWDARSGASLFSPAIEGHATAIAYSPDARLLGAGTEDGKVVLWDARTGSPLGAVQVAAGIVSQLSFSPDGRLFAVGSADQTSTLWDLGSRTRVGTSFPVELGVVPAVSFAPNGHLVIVYLSNAAEWPTDLSTWETTACGIAGRDLTPPEWTGLFPERPYRSVCPH